MVLIPVITSKLPLLGVISKNILDYTSPTILLCSISLFIIFANLNIRPSFYKIISFFSTSAFAVYIIHTHPCIWSVMKDYFIKYAEFNIILVILAVIGTALTIWIVCSLVDKVRQLLFKIIKIDLLATKISKFAEKITNKVADKLTKLCSD